MSSDLVDIFLLSLLAMLNPTLTAAVTVMLLTPNPKRLMAGYLLGAYTTSITLGLLIVFSLHNSSTESTSKHTVSPVEDLVVGVLLLGSHGFSEPGATNRFRNADGRRKTRSSRPSGKPEPTESLPLRLLGKGDPKVTFVVGAILTFPGVSYLNAHHIHKLNPGTVPTVLLVLFFCFMQQIFIELPLLGYVFAPDRTQDTVTRFRSWMSRSGRTAAIIGAAVLGGWLTARGLITLL